MKSQIRSLFLSAALASFFALAYVVSAQEKPTAPAAPPPAPAVTEAPKSPETPALAAEAPAPVAEPAKPAEAAGSGAPALQTTTPIEPAKSDLRRIDTTPETPAVNADEAAPAEKLSSDAANDPDAEQPKPVVQPEKTKHTRSKRVHTTHGSGNDRVSIGHDASLGKGEKADSVVAVFGSATSAGEVGDAVVSVLGNTRVTGPVGDSAVAVLGNTYVNSKIGGEAVAVLGNIELGPDAEIGGDVVSVGGVVKKDPKAVVHGTTQNVSFAANFGDMDWLHAWINQCLLYARPLAIGPNLGWAWCIAFSFLALYVLIALLFRSGVDKCVETLEERPGYSFLAAVLTVLLTPVLIILLCITVVGIALVPFVAAGLFFAGIFGKVVMLAWLGRRVTRLFGGNVTGSAALATLIGGLIVLGLYLVPVLGFLVYKFLGVLGLGVVVYTLMLGIRREKAPLPPVVSVAGVAGTMGSVATEGAAGALIGDAATSTMAPPMIVSAATLPRAGFWIRVAASLLDFLVVAIAVSVLPHFLRPSVLLIFAAYCVVFWTLKATTIGGIVCRLKVVRLDDKPVDWITATVRALGAFLSFVVAGLGFIWVAFDDHKQSWHDKIAGTTVVLMPKGISLV